MKVSGLTQLCSSLQRLGALLILGGALTACNGTVQQGTSTATSGSSTTTSTALRFASGTKGVKIITSIASGGSFTLPLVLPTPTVIPTGYPGANGVTTYNQGVAATQFYDLDGTTVITKPVWLTDFQVGITSLSPSSACATFGGTGAADAQNFYRVSEINCAPPGISPGTGGGLDPVFFRAILNRDTAYLGSGENLMVQVEYQASGLHLNSDGSDLNNVENNLDQLWKVFWHSSLSTATAANIFSIFVPPNYGACLDSGSGADGPGHCALGSFSGYRGASVKTKQFIVPLSALSTLNVLQFARVKGRINQVGNYVNNFCTGADSGSDSPLCLGVVIRSVTLLRM